MIRTLFGLLHIRTARIVSIPCCRLVLLLPFTALVLAGCMVPKAYRVTEATKQNPAGTELTVMLPYTDKSTDGEVSIVYFPNVLEFDCADSAQGGTTPNAMLAATTIHVWRHGHWGMAVRFTGPASTYETPDTLTSALASWWQRNTIFRTCAGLDDEASVRRSLLAQRPQTTIELIQSQFLFAPGSDTEQGRAVLLRPGMRVCASDVAWDSRDPPGWTVAGTTCARVTRAPGGGTWFDPIFGMLKRLTTASHVSGPKPGLAGNTYRIGSWAEVQRPGAVEYLWLLIYPNALPIKHEDAMPAAFTLPILAGIKMTEGTIPPDLHALLKADGASHKTHVDNLCKSTEAICYAFGERAILSAEFTIFLNGTPVDVAVGSTLGDVAALARPDVSSLELIAPGPAVDQAATQRVQRTLSQLRMQRMFDGQPVTVDLSGAGARAYSLPLQPGDRFTW